MTSKIVGERHNVTRPSFPAIYINREGGEVVLADSERTGTTLIQGSDEKFNVGRYDPCTKFTWEEIGFTRMDLPVTIKFDL